MTGFRFQDPIWMLLLIPLLLVGVLAIRRQRRVATRRTTRRAERQGDATRLEQPELFTALAVVRAEEQATPRGHELARVRSDGAGRRR